MLGGSSSASLARQPRSSRHPSERAKLNNVLELRDLPKKKEGIHVLVDAMAAAPRWDAFAAAAFGLGSARQDRSAVLGGCASAAIILVAERALGMCSRAKQACVSQHNLL